MVAASTKHDFILISRTFFEVLYEASKSFELFQIRKRANAETRIGKCTVCGEVSISWRCEVSQVTVDRDDTCATCSATMHNRLGNSRKRTFYRSVSIETDRTSKSCFFNMLLVDSKLEVLSAMNSKVVSSPSVPPSGSFFVEPNNYVNRFLDALLIPFKQLQNSLSVCAVYVNAITGNICYYDQVLLSSFSSVSLDATISIKTCVNDFFVFQI